MEIDPENRLHDFIRSEFDRGRRKLSSHRLINKSRDWYALSDLLAQLEAYREQGLIHWHGALRQETGYLEFKQIDISRFARHSVCDPVKRLP